MFQGMMTRLSEATVASAANINVSTDIVRITGAVDIANIFGALVGSYNMIIFIVPTAGNMNLLNTGNIAVAVTIPQNRVCMLVYSKTSGKWHPGAIS